MILGHRLYGKGPECVVLFNDWLADSTSWDPTLPYLDEDAFTYALVDLRGYGKSLSLTGEYTAAEAAADTFALADQLGWERFHVVGYSMTGMVVERMGVDGEDRLKSIVAVGPVSAAGVPLSDEERQFFLDAVVDDDRCRELAGRITGHRLNRRWQEVKLRLARETRTPEAARGYLDMWTRTDFSEEAAKVKAPIFIIACRFDQPKFLKEDMERTFLQWHPHAELLTIDAGHCPMQEMPVYLATIMEEFLRRHSG